MLNTQYISNSNNIKLAYMYQKPQKGKEEFPEIVFLSGFRSDMRGVQCTRRTGDSKCLIDGGNLGITQQHESVHQNEGVVAIEGRGEGWKGQR